MGIFNRKHHDSGDVEVVKGPSLARAPALLLGSILAAFGLAGLLTNADFPAFSENFTGGTAEGETFLGFEVNGWTNWLCIASGALLLAGAAQHLLARTMSLLVGLALGAASVIALYDGDDVLGLAAANGPTKLGLGLAATWLLITSLLPRRTKTVHHEDHAGHDHVAGRDHAAGRDRVVDRDPEHDAGSRSGRFERDRDADRSPSAHHVPAAPGAGPVAHDEPGRRDPR